MVANGKVFDAVTEFHHLAGCLVAEHDRHRPRSVAVDRRQIRVAEPRRPDAQQHLAFARRIEVQFLDRERL